MSQSCLEAGRFHVRFVDSLDLQDTWIQPQLISPPVGLVDELAVGRGAGLVFRTLGGEPSLALLQLARALGCRIAFGDGLYLRGRELSFPGLPAGDALRGELSPLQVAIGEQALAYALALGDALVEAVDLSLSCNDPISCLALPTARISLGLLGVCFHLCELSHESAHALVLCGE
jgi:hypothetical protein